MVELHARAGMAREAVLTSLYNRKREPEAGNYGVTRIDVRSARGGNTKMSDERYLQVCSSRCYSAAHPRGSSVQSLGPVQPLVNISKPTRGASERTSSPTSQYSGRSYAFPKISISVSRHHATVATPSTSLASPSSGATYRIFFHPIHTGSQRCAPQCQTARRLRSSSRPTHASRSVSFPFLSSKHAARLPTRPCVRAPACAASRTSADAMRRQCI